MLIFKTFYVTISTKGGIEMNIADRLKKIRQTLNMNQVDFGNKINLTKFAISNYENNRNNIPERVILDICRVYNVSEDWIRNESGDMFMTLLEEDEFMGVATEISLSNDSFIRQAIIEYWKLDEKTKNIIKASFLKIADNCRG